MSGVVPRLYIGLDDVHFLFFWKGTERVETTTTIRMKRMMDIPPLH